MKKMIALLLIILIVAAVYFYTADRMKYTSLNEVVMNQINQNNEVRIDIKRYSDDATVSITDKGKVEKILTGLSAVELKKENVTWPSGDYAIRIYENGVEKIGMELLADKNLVWINEHKNGVYKVNNQIDLLRVIEDQHLDWNVPKK